MRNFFLLATLAILTSLSGVQAEPDAHRHSVIVPYDPAIPVDQQDPDQYFLDEATFNRLWQLAKDKRAQQLKSADADIDSAGQGHTISSGLYRISAGKDQVKVDARLQLHTFGKQWNRVPLAFTGAQLTAITLDGVAASFDAGDLLVEKAGSHTVDVQFEIARVDGWDTAILNIPPAAAAMVSVKLDDDKSRVTINDGRGQVSAADGTTTAAIGPANSIRIQRSGITRGGADQAREPTSVQIDARLYTTAAIERLEGDFHYEFAGAKLDTFSLTFDPSLTPTGFRIANLKSWSLRKADDLQTLEFVLAQAAEDRLSVTLIGERQTPQTPTELTYPQLGAGARRTEQHLALFHANDLEVRPKPTQEFRRSAPKNRDASSGFELAAAFNLSGDAVPLPYSLTTAEHERRIEGNYVFQIGASKVETVAKLDLISPGADLLRASIAIPEGMKVQSVASSRLQDWWIDADKLQLRFSGLTPDRTIVILNFARTLDDTPTEIAFSPLAIDGFSRASGTGLVIAHMATRTLLDFDKRRTEVREIASEEAGREFEVLAPYEHKHGFAFDVPDFIAKVTIEELEAKYDASWVLLAETFDNWVRIGARVDVELTRAALKRVRFTLPAGLPEAIVSGDRVREVSSALAGELREYTVSFQSDVVDAVQFDVTTEIPHAGEATLPDLGLPDADRLERYLVVENLSKDELKLETSAAELTSKDLFPYFDDTITSKWLYRAREGWEVKLLLDQLETSAGNRASVLLAELTTALRSNGDQWVNANYRIQNRSLQFLPVNLPDGSELISVKVAGENVRADRSSDGGTYLIPLVQTKPGQLAYPVEFVYLKRGKQPLGSQTKPVLDDPDLVGIVIEKTVWNVIVPEGFSLGSFEGNMSEVPDEQRKIEQLSSMETELIRLNGVATSERYSSDTRDLAKRNAQNLTSVYESALEASRPKRDKRNKWSSSMSSYSDEEIDPQFEQLRETLDEQKALAFSGNSHLSLVDQLSKQSKSGNRDYQWAGNSKHINSRHGEIYSRAQEQNERVTGQLNINDNLIILGGNREMLEQQAAPEANQKPADASAQGFRQQQLDKLDDQGQAEGQSARLTQLRSDQLGTFNADVVDEIQQKGSPLTQNQPFINAVTNARANPYAFDNRDQQPGLGFGQADVQPTPEPDTTASPLTDAPPVTQRFKPAGRVSLDVNFPTDGNFYHFKKLKDHAKLTLKIEQASTGNRPALVAWMAFCLAIVFLGNKVVRRGRTKS